MDAKQIAYMTIEEFEALPEDARFELIDGVLYPLYDTSESNNCPVSRSQACEWRTSKAAQPSSRGSSNAQAAPAAVSAQGNWADTKPIRIHQELVMSLSAKIFNHINAKKGDCRVYPAPFGVRLSETTVVEPDITVVCDKDKLTDKGCTGAPDWIIEIVSPSNPAHDYLEKCGLYLNTGVREYWIVDPKYRQITVYNEETPYIPHSFTFEDTVKVSIYDDLAINFPEIMEQIEL